MPEGAAVTLPQEAGRQAAAEPSAVSESQPSGADNIAAAFGAAEQVQPTAEPTAPAAREIHIFAPGGEMQRMLLRLNSLSRAPRHAHHKDKLGSAVHSQVFLSVSFSFLCQL